MKTIYKYTLQAETKQELMLPVNAVILSVKNQYDNIVVYALIDTTTDIMETHDFFVFGTGHEITENLRTYTFLDTVLISDGKLVFHIYYRKVSEHLRSELDALK